MECLNCAHDNCICYLYKYNGMIWSFNINTYMDLFLSCPSQHCTNLKKKCYIFYPLHLLRVFFSIFIHCIACILCFIFSLAGAAIRAQIFFCSCSGFIRSFLLLCYSVHFAQTLNCCSNSCQFNAHRWCAQSWNKLQKSQF